MFKIALLVVGGGYAILAVADQVFGRRLKWLREGELFDRLPVFQMVPGLIAGNTAIYTGLRVAGRRGAATGLVAVALPAWAIFLAVSYGYGCLPVEHVRVAGALAGLRAALTGILFGTLVKGWRRSVRGVYGYAAFAVVTALAVSGGVNPALLLVAAMVAGVVRAHAGGPLAPAAGEELPPVALEPLTRAQRLAWVGGLLGVLGAAVACGFGPIIAAFTAFGLLGFGGGYVLVPLYLRAFVGPEATLLQLPPEEFTNLMALTQATPGPISVNAATFFGFRLGGALGAAVATAALLAPSFFLLTAVLTGLARARRNRTVQGLLWGVRPATSALLAAAGVVFAGMSIATRTAAGWEGHPLALALAVFAGAMLVRGRVPIVATLFACAAAGGLCASWL